MQWVGSVATIDLQLLRALASPQQTYALTPRALSLPGMHTAISHKYLWYDVSLRDGSTKVNVGL